MHSTANDSRSSPFSPPQRAIRTLLADRYDGRYGEAEAAWDVKHSTFWSWLGTARVNIRGKTLDRIASKEGLDAAELMRGNLHSVRIADRSDDAHARALGSQMVNESDPALRRQLYVAREMYINGRRASSWGADENTTSVGVSFVSGTYAYVAHITGIDPADPTRAFFARRGIAPESANAVIDELHEESLRLLPPPPRV